MTGRHEVVVPDLGLGNRRSVVRALERAGGDVRVERDPDVIARAARLVVPGQGGFGDCAAALRAGAGPAIVEAIRRGAPYLGICVGMQILFESSEESPRGRGLGLFAGRVERLAPSAGPVGPVGRLKVPHTGWNEVTGRHPLLRDREWFYFVHSYHCVPVESSVVAATADYCGSICAAVSRDNVFACQFHPEKSQSAGHSLLTRWLEESRPCS